MSAHVKAQALRFARVSVLAFVAALFQTGGKIGWASLWAMIAGAGETGLRQVLPVKAIPAVDAVLADVEKAVVPPPPTTGPTPSAKG